MMAEIATLLFLCTLRFCSLGLDCVGTSLAGLIAIAWADKKVGGAVPDRRSSTIMAMATGTSAAKRRVKVFEERASLFE